MASLSYREAEKTMLNDKFSRFEKLSSKKHIILSPKFLGRVKEGITEQLNSEIRLVSDLFDGVLIAYNNIRLEQRHGLVMDEMPYIHFDIEADFIVFRPVIGCTLRAKVNKIGKNHIGCLVHDCFNASIHKPRHVMNGWQGSDLKIGDEFLFEVDRIYTQNKVLSVRGHLIESGDFGKKNKKKRNRTSFTEPSKIDVNKRMNTSADEPVDKKFRFSDDSMEVASVNISSVLGESIATETDLGLREGFSSTKKKKKKKKHKEEKTYFNNNNDQSDSLLDLSAISAATGSEGDQSLVSSGIKKHKKHKQSDHHDDGNGLSNLSNLTMFSNSQRTEDISDLSSASFSLSNLASQRQKDTASSDSGLEKSEKKKKQKKHKHIKQEMNEQFDNQSENVKLEMKEQSLSQSETVLGPSGGDTSLKMDPDSSLMDKNSKKKKKHKSKKDDIDASFSNPASFVKTELSNNFQFSNGNDSRQEADNLTLDVNSNIRSGTESPLLFSQDIVQTPTAKHKKKKKKKMVKFD